ncbi:MAG: hypothetical protein J9259_03905 [Thermoplasmata archaeon YP2-bin.285]|uniref:Pab87 octamerisation domain-containing protein n=2 Tax=Candidatus Sysuiplasma superficiale TaxID=2823368 RepID=A0A8J8CDZ2_9ARCH|nr:hypothetical protein [Candidatus Sysuiplasma superficiale]
MPDAGVKVSVLSNTTGFPMSEIAHYGIALALDADPERIHYFRRNRILRQLQGRYGSFMNRIVDEITVHGDLLELRNNFVEGSVILVPETIDENHSSFYTMNNGRRTISEFFIRQDGRVELIHGGVRFRKIA